MKTNLAAGGVSPRCVREAMMELLIACAMTLFGVTVVFMFPRWLRYTDALNTRKQAEFLNRRWPK